MEIIWGKKMDLIYFLHPPRVEAPICMHSVVNKLATLYTFVASLSQLQA